MYKIIVPLIFGLFQALRANKSPKLCVTATKACREDVFVCALEYGRFLAECEIGGQKHTRTRSNGNTTSFVAPPTTKPCSQKCVEAIGDLRRTKRGKELHECDCQLDGDCLIVKARVGKCLNSTIKVPKSSCTLALWNCSQDPTCASLQSKFLEDCRAMINGVRCEKKCQEIQKQLFEEITYGKALATCECDGQTEAYCRAIRAHAKHLRCEPGMDRSGTPIFHYVATDSEIIHGDGVVNTNNKTGTASFQNPTRTLVVLILILFLLL